MHTVTAYRFHPECHGKGQRVVVATFVSLSAAREKAKEINISGYQFCDARVDDDEQYRLDCWRLMRG